MNNIRRFILGATPALLLGLTSVAAAAQEMGLDPPSELATQGLRAYWHVFIAYTIAIVLVAVWAGSIAKRLGELEQRLSE